MDDIKRWLGDFVNVLTQNKPFGWNNVLDVLIVAVFIYYVLLLIRGTRAVQLLIGVMVLVLIYFVATSLHLTLTTLLLQALFAVALIALVVVFQPELRRALGQIGQLGPLNRLLAPGSASLRHAPPRRALHQRADRRDRRGRLRGDAGHLHRGGRTDHRRAR